MPEMADVAEVVTCSKRKVNAYLSAGYRLLAVETETVWTQTPKQARKENGPPGYVLRALRFVVGRPEGVEPFAPDKAG